MKIDMSTVAMKVVLQRRRRKIGTMMSDESGKNERSANFSDTKVAQMSLILTGG